MPDVAERLDDLGAEVLMQPEAGAWAGHGSGLPDWPPDAMQRAIWAQVQRLPGLRYGALSNLTGNFFDLYFDGTATITKDAAESDEPGYLLGRLPGPGFVARAPWVVADPPAGVAIDDVDTRRAALDAAGFALQPGSGAPTENGQLEGFVWADITLPDRGPHGDRVARSSDTPAPIAAPETGGPQWSPSLAPLSAGIAVAWTDVSQGNERPAASWYDEEVRFGPVRFYGDTRRPSDQQGNAYDARVAGVQHPTSHRWNLLWSSFGNQSWSIYAQHGSMSPNARVVDDSPTTPSPSAEGFGNENINHDPVVAVGPDGSFFTAWADVRGRRVPWRIAVARSDFGDEWSANVRADGGGALERTDEDLARVEHTGGDQFAPAIAGAPDGDVLVAWQDHATAEPRIVLGRGDASLAFGTPAAIDPTGGAQLRPSVAVAPDGGVAVAWEQMTDGGAGREIRLASDPEGDGSFEPSVAVDPARPAGTDQARAQLAFTDDGTLAIVWQDDRAGDEDVLLATRAPDGAISSPARVDDGPDSSAAILPAIAATADGLAIVYEESERIRLVLLATS